MDVTIPTEDFTLIQGIMTSPDSADKDDKYQLDQEIGRGVYAKVYRGIIKSTQQPIAVKKMVYGSNGIDTSQLGECSNLKALNHPNIITLIDVIIKSREYGGYIYLVTELLDMDLKTYMLREPIDTEGAIEIARQLLLGLQACHHQRIMHRDLQPENIYIKISQKRHRNHESHIKGKIVIKIGDFGDSRSIVEPDREYTGLASTLWYRAPEVLLNGYYGNPLSYPYTEAVDLWSLGCILGELLLSRVVFPGYSELNQLLRIFRQFGTPSQELLIRLGLSENVHLANFPGQQISMLFPGQRPEIHRLLAHLFKFDPQIRWSATRCLQESIFQD